VATSFETLIPYVGRALELSDDELLNAFRPATRADVPGILAFRRAVNLGMWWDDARFLDWRYFDRLGDGDAAPYWIFVKGGVVMGACGLEPVTLVIDGEPRSCRRMLDIMVHPDVDGLGLGAFMNLILFRHFPVTIVTGSNARSHQLLSRLFRHAADLVTWKAPVASRYLFEERLYPGRFPRILAAGADLCLRLRRRVRRTRPPAGIRISRLTRFDERVTSLTRECEGNGRVMVRRDAPYLNWRFIHNPRCRHVVFGAFRGDRLAGYVVARLNLARPNPHREGEIVDWLASDRRPDSQRILSALMGSALQHLVDRGAALVTCAAHGAGVHRAALTNGFVQRTAERVPFFVKAAVPDVHRRLAGGAGWFLTRADLDVE
jgi:hypothetical protein